MRDGRTSTRKEADDAALEAKRQERVTLLATLAATIAAPSYAMSTPAAWTRDEKVEHIDQITSGAMKIAEEILAEADKRVK